MIEYCILLGAVIEIKFLAIALCIGLVLLAAFIIYCCMVLAARVERERTRFNDD